jgi:hypothetical protein
MVVKTVGLEGKARLAAMPPALDLTSADRGRAMERGGQWVKAAGVVCDGYRVIFMSG